MNTTGKVMIIVGSIIGLGVIAFYVRVKLDKKRFAENCQKNSGPLESTYTCNYKK